MVARSNISIPIMLRYRIRLIPYLPPRHPGGTFRYFYSASDIERQGVSISIPKMRRQREQTDVERIRDIISRRDPERRKTFGSKLEEERHKGIDGDI